MLLKKSGLNIDLVNEHEDDVKLAKLLMHKKGVLILIMRSLFTRVPFHGLNHCFIHFRSEEERAHSSEASSFHRAQ